MGIKGKAGEASTGPRLRSRGQPPANWWHELETTGSFNGATAEEPWSDRELPHLGDAGKGVLQRGHG